MSNISIALGLHADERDAEEVDEDFEKRLENTKEANNTIK